MTNPANTKLISLTQGKFAIVDAEDYEFLMQWKWYCGNGYAIRCENKKTLGMHRIIMNTPDYMWTDHIDMNTLNNRKSNLRICTPGQNQHNTKPRRGSSKYKGVYWYKRDKNWAAQITLPSGRKTIGYYDNEEAAAIAYNHYAILHYGEFARLNVI